MQRQLTGSGLVNTATRNPYNILADMNGDGVVNATDVLLVRSRIGNRCIKSRGAAVWPDAS